MSDRAPPDWERTRHEYEHCPDSLDVIAKRNGVSRTTLFARTKAEGWERKVKTIWRQRRGKDELAALAVETSRRVLGASIAGRLYRAIDRKLQEIEKRMSERPDGELQSAADAEREARSLAALARLYAKLVELDEAAKTNREAEAKKQESAKETSVDADRLRRELALRLKRLA
jgi:hypothetical protein